MTDIGRKVAVNCTIGCDSIMNLKVIFASFDEGKINICSSISIRDLPTSGGQLTPGNECVSMFRENKLPHGTMRYHFPLVDVIFPLRFNPETQACPEKDLALIIEDNTLKRNSSNSTKQGFSVELGGIYISNLHLLQENHSLSGSCRMIHEYIKNISTLGKGNLVVSVLKVYLV